MSAGESLTYEERQAQRAVERGDIAGAQSWMRVKADVDLAPPLSPAQIATIRVLLAPELRDAEAA
jgi:redox-sensitive bicupin YhaK (pirin superfamily)